MSYRFKGEDGSLGLKRGNIYEIIFNTTATNFIVANIKVENRYISCFYDSIEMFEKNWEGIIGNNNILNIDLGNTCGITRQVDELGRVVIPKEFRKELNLNEKDKVEVYLLKEGIYIRKK